MIATPPLTHSFIRIKRQHVYAHRTAHHHNIDRTCAHADRCCASIHAAESSYMYMLHGVHTRRICMHIRRRLMCLRAFALANRAVPSSHRARSLRCARRRCVFHPHQHQHPYKHAHMRACAAPAQHTHVLCDVLAGRVCACVRVCVAGMDGCGRGMCVIVIITSRRMGMHGHARMHPSSSMCAKAVLKRACVFLAPTHTHTGAYIVFSRVCVIIYRETTTSTSMRSTSTHAPNAKKTEHGI